MPVAKLSIASGEAAGLEELGGAPPLVANMLAEPLTQAMRTRPGVSAWPTFPSSGGVVYNAAGDAYSATGAVIGMYPLDSNTLVYVTADRRIWAVSSGGVVTALSYLTAPTTLLAGTLRPVFAQVFNFDAAGNKVVIAGGGAIQAWKPNALPLTQFSPPGLAARLDGTEHSATHVGSIALRLFANVPGTDNVAYTDFTADGGPDSTGWAGVLYAQAKPDPVLAVAENTNELFAWGSRTLQAYVPDATADFVLARTLNIGCAAPYSIVPIDDGFGWLTDRRQIITSNARGFQPISAPYIDRQLAQITTVADCWGFRARMDAYDLQCWVFPSDRRTFCYEANGKTWSEWRSYDAGTWVAPFIQSYVYWPEQNLHLVGLADGTIGQLDLTVANEGTQPMVSQLWLGFEDHDTILKKQNASLQFSLRRGVGDPTGDPPQIVLDWRDDVGGWSQPLYRSVGNLGDYGTVVDFRSLGVYQARQWRITATSSYPLVMGSVSERYEVLET